MDEIMFKPVFQGSYHSINGDFLRASIASIFGLELEQVPHFGLFSDGRYPYILSGFYWGMGYNWIGNGNIDKDELKEEHSINGLFEASVPNGSQIKTHCNHSVIIDLNGIVVHDPDKNETWKGKNILKSGQLEWWTQVSRRPE